MTRRSFPKLALLPPLIFLALASLFSFGLGRDDALPSTLVGQQMPALPPTGLGEAPAFDISTLNHDGLRIVNYWASWCAPCRVEHPNLTEFSQNGIPVIGVNYKDRPDDALSFLDELGDPYVGHTSDPLGKTAINWGVYGVPETFLIDADGVVLLRHPGPVTQRVIARDFAPIIAKYK
jgi:cytochrome c biogenesis protein CcmG/thiol:disulfide interchange protein DsbE